MDGERGFTYIWILFAVALAGIVLAAAGQVWQTEARREKEVELMFVGEQFRQALGSYYESSPSMPKRYPDSLEKLLADDRFPKVKRHLRRIFHDPATGKNEWGLVKKPGTGIVGIHSLSSQRPFKRGNFPSRYATFANAASYKDWQFIYLPGEGGSAMPQPDSPPNAQADPGSPSQSDPRSQSQPGQSTRPEPDLSPFSSGPGESSPYPVPAGP